jgi:hypothetical protein
MRPVAPLVPTSGDVPAAHLQHREAFRRFVIEKATPWHREHLTALYDRWEEWTERFFAGAMQPPYVMLLEPSNPRRFADCSRISGFGGRSQIRIRPSLVRGTYLLRPGAAYAAGRRRFVEDVLLHEMVHQWQQEISHQTDDGYHGHGPAFRDRANAIGRDLGFPLVRTSKRRGPDRDLPSCAQWPHNVRPEAYYLGAVVEACPD